jgi:hypothetical protein
MKELFQFRTLYRMFLLRVVDLDTLSADGDPTKLLGQIAAIFATISFFACAPLITVGGKLDQNTRWDVEFFFIAASMLAVGLFATLSWDSIFPDKRDFLVLGPLPVARRTILAAKLAALTYALGLLIFALNVFIAVIWPPILASTNGLKGLILSYAAYVIAIVLGSAFMFFSVLMAQGLTSQLLPRQAFLRLSAPIQAAAFCLCLGTFILEPGNLTDSVLRSSVTQWLPPYWFFGMAQQIRGGYGTLQPVFSGLAQRGLIAWSIVTAGAAGTLLSFYLLRLGKIVESPDILPTRRCRPVFPQRSLSATLVLFCARTLLRSKQHRVILSFYYGVGIAIVLAYALALVAERSSQNVARALVGTPMLGVCLLMMCVTVGGIRIVAPMPMALASNWIFRTTELNTPEAYLADTRVSFYLSGGDSGVVSLMRAVLFSGAMAFSLRPPCCPRTFGTVACGTVPSRFRKNPFYLFLLAGERKSPIRFLGLRGAASASDQRIGRNRNALPRSFDRVLRNDCWSRSGMGLYSLEEH